MTSGVDSISYCISTNGRQLQKTLVSIRSITETMKRSGLNHEIVVAGAVAELKQAGVELVLVDAASDAMDGRLSRLRNLAAQKSRGDIIVFIDDDIVFPAGWITRLEQFGRDHPWEVLGNRILLPDGGRYWDRATISPHRMVDYDHPEDDPNLYQCGCFWVMRRKVFESEKWNDDIRFYNERIDGINEDVEYSQRLTRRGYTLAFDPKNHVWHWDDRYAEWFTEQEGLRCIRKQDITDTYGVDEYPATASGFTKLLKALDAQPGN